MFDFISAALATSLCAWLQKKHMTETAQTAVVLPPCFPKLQRTLSLSAGDKEFLHTLCREYNLLSLLYDWRLTPANQLLFCFVHFTGMNAQKYTYNYYHSTGDLTPLFKFRCIYRAPNGGFAVERASTVALRTCVKHARADSKGP